MTENDLIKQIEAFAAERGVAETTVTKMAVGNHRLYGTLKSGGSCSVKTANRLLQYIASNVTPENAEAS